MFDIFFYFQPKPPQMDFLVLQLKDDEIINKRSREAELLFAGKTPQNTWTY